MNVRSWAGLRNVGFCVVAMTAVAWAGGAPAQNNKRPAPNCGFYTCQPNQQCLTIQNAGGRTTACVVPGSRQCGYNICTPTQQCVSKMTSGGMSYQCRG